MFLIFLSLMLLGFAIFTSNKKAKKFAFIMLGVMLVPIVFNIL